MENQCADEQEPKHYKINTLDDLHQIPDDRLEACLSEVAIAIRMNKSITNKICDAANQICDTEPKDFSKPNLHNFVWIDDGKTETTIHLHADNEEIARVEIERVQKS